jgi:hypothetical protein
VREGGGVTGTITKIGWDVFAVGKRNPADISYLHGV